MANDIVDQDSSSASGGGPSARIFKTFRAFGALQAIYFLSQIAAIPLLITAWGKSVYGEWVLLSSVPAYLTIADLGFGFAVANDVAMREAKGDRSGALASLQSAWAVVCVLCLLFAAAFLLFVYTVPFWRILHLSEISPRTCIAIADLLGLQVLLAQLQGVVRAPLRCGGHFVHGVRIKNFESIGNLVGTCAVAWLRLPPLYLAISIALVSIGTNIALFVESRRRAPWLTIGFRHGKADQARMIVWPAFTQNLIPLSSALSLQGSLAVIGIASGTAGPIAALRFASARTMTRVISQLTATVEATFLPELSIAVAQGDLVLARRLHHRASQLSFWLGLASAAVLRIVGPALYRIWTRGRLELDMGTFDVLLFALVLNGLYFGSIAVPLAINKHMGISVRMLIFTLVAVPLSYLLCLKAGIFGVALAVALVELAMLCSVVPLACRLIGDSIPVWATAALSPNFGWLYKRLVRTRAI